MRKEIICLLLCLLAFNANAVTVRTIDFSYVRSDADPYLAVDTGSTLFRVTETFTSAAELGGTQNLYQYSIENLTTDLYGIIFSRGNDDLASDLSTRVMNAPTGWSVRHVWGYLWETITSNTNYWIAPGETLSGFELYTSTILIDNEVPSNLDPSDSTRSWIMASNSLTWNDAARVDIFGVHTRVVPLPAAGWLFGSGFIGLIGLARRR